MLVRTRSIRWVYDSCERRTDIAPSRCSRIHSNDYATLESKGQCCGTVLYFDSTRWVGMIVGVHPQKCRWLFIVLIQSSNIIQLIIGTYVWDGRYIESWDARSKRSESCLRSPCRVCEFCVISEHLFRFSKFYCRAIYGETIDKGIHGGSRRWRCY